MNEKEKTAKPKPGGEKEEIPRSPEDAEAGGLTREQRNRGYYYDDSHGYQIYVPASEDTEDEETGGGND